MHAGATNAGGRSGDAEGQGPIPPEGFTLGLALFDGVPVALFCLSTLVLGGRLGSPAFVAGAVLAFAAGLGKVCWKLLLALGRGDHPLLSRQLRYLMPLGFALMATGIATKMAVLALVAGRLLSLPSCPLFALWPACMLAMVRFARHRDQLDARSNWVEQATNSLGQAALLAALLLA